MTLSLHNILILSFTARASGGQFAGIGQRGWGADGQDDRSFPFDPLLPGKGTWNRIFPFMNVFFFTSSLGCSSPGGLELVFDRV